MELLVREPLVANTKLIAVVEYISRLLFAAIFIHAAIGKLVDTASIQALMTSVGVPSVLVWPAALFDLAIAISLIFGISWRIVAPLAALYCIMLGLIFHFRPENPNDMVHFAKNLSIAGGLILLALRSKHKAS